MSKKKKALTAIAQAPLVERINKYVAPEVLVEGPNSREKGADPNYPDKVAAIAVSIFKNGQQQPASAYTDAEGRDVLFAGHTRADAVKLIRTGFEAIDPADGDKKLFHNPDAVLWVAVDPTARTAEEAYVNSVVENFARNDLNPIQEAIVHETLRDANGPFGWSDTRIANTFGRENTNRVALLRSIRENLGDKYQGMIERGELAVYPARDLIQVPVEERDALLARARQERADGSVFYDGAVLRSYLQTKAAANAETGAGTPDGGGGDEQTTPEPRARGPKGEPAAPKRNAKDLAKLAESYKNEEGADPAVVNLLKKLNDWFACKCQDRALFNAIEAVQTAKARK